MKNAFEQIKNNKWIRIAVITLLPVICCGLYALIDGHSPFGISLRYSTWNDELFYYKLVESVISKGYPRGFFGFNESHARVLSFAAWSPTLILPWIIFGRIFGWKIFSSYIYNMIFFCGSMFTFGVITKPDWKKTALISVPFLLFPMNYRYIFSVMPEIIVWALLIVFYSFALKVSRDRRLPESGAGQSRKGLGPAFMLFAISFMLTTMRPYFILLMLLPCIILFIGAKGKKKIVAALTGIAVMVATITVYYLINKFLSAPYFSGLFDTRWLSKFMTDGIAEGLSFFREMFVSKNLAVFHRIILAFTGGSQSDGAIYFVYITLLLLLAADIVYMLIRRKKACFIVKLHCLLSMIVLLLAINIMYKPYEGSKHLLAFIIPGLLLLIGSGEDIKTEKMQKNYIRPAIFTFLLSMAFVSVLILKRPYQADYAVPYSDKTKDAEVSYWSDIYKNEISLAAGISPSYDNTVIWVYGDEPYDPSDTDYKYEYWQLLYNLPAGMGISCCTADYLLDDPAKNVLSGYITTSTGGMVDHMLSESPDWTLIGRSASMVMYARTH